MKLFVKKKKELTLVKAKIPKRGYQNCWEYWHCEKQAKKECPVYKAKDGKRCWIYMDNLDVFEWAKPKIKHKKCSECPWYKKVNNIKDE